MRFDEFYRLGRALRGSVAPQQPTAPSTPTYKQQPTDSYMSVQPPKRANYNVRQADRLIDFFMSQGMDPRFAAGATANGVVESGLDPTAWNHPEGSFGTFQHRGKRLDDLRSYASRLGYDTQDTLTHAGFVLHELQTTEKNAYHKIMGTNPQTAGDYAVAFDKYFERSDGAARESRRAIAGQIYDDYFGPEGRYSNKATGGGMLTYDDSAYSGFGRGNAGVDQRTQTILSALPLSMGQTGTVSAISDFVLGTPVDSQSMQKNSNVPLSYGSPAQSSTSGQPTSVPVGRSSNEAYSGGMATGLSDIFMRRPNENDQSFRDRRRNMFLNAAEGFQMLSRGEHADFVTPTQQRLNERQRRVDNRLQDDEQTRQQSNADRTFELQQTQEARLQRAQALEEHKFALEQVATIAQRQQDLEMQGVIADYLESVGEPELAGVARTGATENAMKFYTEKLDIQGKTPAFRLSAWSAQQAMSIAKQLGQDEMANILADPNSPPDAVEKVFDTLIDMVSESTDPKVEAIAVEALRNGIDQRLNPQEQQHLYDLAPSAVKGGKTGYGKWAEMHKMYSESKGPQGAALEAAKESLINQVKEQEPASAKAYDAGRMSMVVGSMPEFTPGATRGNLLIPVSKYLSSIPGIDGQELAKSLFDVDHIDIVGSDILQANRAGAIGQLTEGMKGAISDFESRQLLSQMGSSAMDRVSILALGQIMMAKQSIMDSDIDVTSQYLHEVDIDPEKTYSATELRQRKEAARKQFEVFPKFASDADRVAESIRVLQEGGYTSFDDVPPEILGKVVLTPAGFVPLFKDYYPEYKK